MKDDLGKDGTNQDGADASKMSTGEFLRTFRINIECLICQEKRNTDFQEKMERYAHLTPKKRLKEMNIDLLQMRIDKAMFYQDYTSIMVIAIADLQAQLDTEKVNLEEKKKAAEEAKMKIKPGAKKLVLDCDEGELVAFFKEAFRDKRNKKKNLIFNGTNLEFGQWILDSIILTRNRELNINTIKKELSKIVEPVS